MIDEDTEFFNEYKSNWGIFVVESSYFAYEKWYCSDGICYAYIKEGEIKNETTIHITKSYRIKNDIITEEKERDETYHFKQFSPKPDSTNSFIP